jgi:uncharacterized protein YjiS (DUF1127 family)
MACGNTTCVTGREFSRDRIDAFSFQNSINKGAARSDLWLARIRQRQALARLDDRLLRDIGVTRDQAKAESRKPFWRR